MNHPQINTCIREVEDGPHTIWIDNFSKIHGCKIPTIDAGAWRNCLWTGTALRKYTGTVPVDVSIQRDAAGQVIPAMPDDLFANEAAFNSIFDRYAMQTDYWETSFVQEFKVTCVPLKPDAHKVNNRKHRRALQADSDTLHSMYPKEIAAVNIGSNLGLGKIIRVHYDDRKQGPGDRCQAYSALNVDENIFMRVLKVAHHKSRPRPKLAVNILDSLINNGTCRNEGDVLSRGAGHPLDPGCPIIYY